MRGKGEHLAETDICVIAKVSQSLIVQSECGPVRIRASFVHHQSVCQQVCLLIYGAREEILWGFRKMSRAMGLIGEEVKPLVHLLIKHLVFV